jgi:hypothetical protein
MASATRVQRSIEFQFDTDLGPIDNSIAGLQQKLETLKKQFEGAEIGSAEFNRLGQEIQQTSSKLKTLDERFEGLGIEQKNAMIVDSFNVVVGAVGAVTGALVAFGVESKALEGVEKRLLGIITVVSSLREVSNGLAAFNKVWPALTANIGKATAALRAFALANPFTAIAIGIAAVTAAVYALIRAQDQESKQLEKIAKLREKQNELAKKDKEELRKDIIEFAELGKTDLQIAEDKVRALRNQYNEEKRKFDFLKRTQGNSEAAARQALKVDKLGIQLNDAYRQRQIETKKAQIEADKEAIENGKKAADQAKKNAEDKAKQDEELANRAVKQLNDQRQATEDLINLYIELYPEKVSGGQFEFNTELDKTNFKLQEQLDILFSLNNGYEDLADQLEEIDFEESVSFFSQEQLAVFKKLRDANKTDLQLQLDALDATYREDLALFEGNEEMKSKITAQYEEDRAKLRRQYAIKTAQDVLGVTSSFLSTVAEINQQSLELQLLQAAGNQAAIDKINADALEKQKKLRIAQVLITTAESILNGFNATSTLPPPFNLIAGGVLGAAYAALGAKTIATINATTLEGGGSTGGGFNNIPGGGSFSLPGGGGVSTTPSTGAILPGLGGGRVAGAPTVGTIGQEPLRAYVLAGDVTNGVQANIALNNRRRLAG